MISLIFVFLAGCFSGKHVTIGTVDSIEGELCEVQLASEDIIIVESVLCSTLREGDTIKVVRLRSGKDQR